MVYPLRLRLVRAVPAFVVTTGVVVVAACGTSASGVAPLDGGGGSSDVAVRHIDTGTRVHAEAGSDARVGHGDASTSRDGSSSVPDAQGSESGGDARLASDSGRDAAHDVVVARDAGGGGDAKEPADAREASDAHEAGPACAPLCPDGHACGASTDCGSRVCQGGVCVAQVCAPFCDDGSVCGADGDCGSHVCTAGTCAAPACAPTCPNASPCGTNDDCASLVCSAGACVYATSCAALLDANPALASGPYLLDLDGGGPGLPRTFYCDMTGGGWTMVMNQVPTAPLADLTTTINAPGFGVLTESWRLGDPDITQITPNVAWKMTDATNSVYVTPACVVDWTINYTGMPQSPCTTGYTDTTFAKLFNPSWVSCDAKGIGINNGAQFCSMRADNGGPVIAGNPAYPPDGAAYPCSYGASMTVSLWFQ
jgi:hypothetical protein